MQVQVGEIVDGKVTGVKNFGAFVQMPCGTTGMVHISEVSTEYIPQLSDVLSEGQSVRVKVISVTDEGKVALSIKKADQPLEVAPQPKPPRPSRADSGKVWQPKPQAQASNLSFEDMMSRFKTQSEEKISDLRRSTESRRGGYSRKRG